MWLVHKWNVSQPILSSQTGSNKLASDLGLLLIFPSFWHVHIASSESAWLYNYYFICLSSMPPCFHGAYWPLWSHTTQSLSKAVIAQWVFFSLTFSICWNGFFYIKTKKQCSITFTFSFTWHWCVTCCFLFNTPFTCLTILAKIYEVKSLLKQNRIFNVLFFSGDGTGIVKAQGISLWSTPVLCSCFNFKCNSCSVWLTLLSILGVQY